MRASTLALFLLLIAIHTNARNYYFSSISGKDNNPVNSINTPWRTLNKLNSIHAQPGDYFLLKSAEIFTGFIISYYNGTFSKPITITTYGGTAPAIINGYTTITGWAPYGNGIYYSNIINPQSKVLHNVAMDNQLQQLGRYPNDYPGTGGFLVYESQQSTGLTTTITSRQLPEYGITDTYTGATLNPKSYLSSIEHCPITNINGNQLSFTNTNMFYQLQTGSDAGYFLTNSILTLDQLGEWYYNPTQQRLYMYFGAVNPHAHKIEVSTVDTLFQPRSGNYIVENIKFRGANKYAVCNNFKNMDRLIFKKDSFLLTGITAIALANRSKIAIDNCTIDQANNNGIIIGYGCDSPYVLNSTIKNIAPFPGNMYDDSIFNNRMGYALFCADTKTKGLHAENNKIDNIAMIGIYITGSHNFLYRNFITNTCQYLDDAGAIYVSGTPNKTGTDNTIRRNLVFNARGNNLGYPCAYPIPNLLFLDDYAGGVTADSNFLQNSGQSCIYAHNAYNSTFRYNTLSNARRALLEIQDDNVAKNNRVANIVIEHNQFYIQDTTQKFYSVQSGSGTDDNNIEQFGIIDNNTLVAPNVNNGIIAVSHAFNNPYLLYYHFPQWQSMLHYDLHTKTNTPPSYMQSQTFYAVDRDSTIQLSPLSNWTRLDGTPISGAVRLKDHTGIILLKTVLSITTNVKTALKPALSTNTAYLK
jgi:hypothetical protein